MLALKEEGHGAGGIAHAGEHGVVGMSGVWVCKTETALLQKIELEKGAGLDPVELLEGNGSFGNSGMCKLALLASVSRRDLIFLSSAVQRCSVA